MGTMPPVVDQIEGEWRFFRINVPADSNLRGWYLNVKDIVGTVKPRISVRRDRLPPSPPEIQNVVAGSVDWLSGAAWSQDIDFAGSALNADGTSVTGQQFLAAIGPNRPLQVGTYYVGILAGSASASIPPKTVSYTLRSRGIGNGYNIPITPLEIGGAPAAVDNLPARDFQFFSHTIPAGAHISSWQINLLATTGEMFFQTRRDSIPISPPPPMWGNPPGALWFWGGNA